LTLTILNCAPFTCCRGPSDLQVKLVIVLPSRVSLIDAFNQAVRLHYLSKLAQRIPDEDLSDRA